VHSLDEIANRVGLIVVHVATIAPELAYVFPGSPKIRYPPAGIRELPPATGHDGRWR
jgi:hypothetical protein